MYLEDYLFVNRSKEDISAFAFNIGRMLENAIDVQTNNLQTRNRDLEAKVLNFTKELEFQINNTITGDVRNKLTEINIRFWEVFEITKNS